MAIRGAVMEWGRNAECARGEGGTCDRYRRNLDAVSILLGSRTSQGPVPHRRQYGHDPSAKGRGR